MVKLRRIESNAWKSWYQKREVIDQDMPRLARLFKENNVSRILDVGCGIGCHTIYFDKKGFKVDGFDFSAYAITYAEQRIKKYKSKATLQVWDMCEKFPYPNGLFDAVLLVRVFRHYTMEIIKKIVKEVCRVVKKEGYVYVQVPTLESALKSLNLKIKLIQIEIEEGTFIPTKGPYKGIPHRGFTEIELRELFRDFRTITISMRDNHYNWLGRKKDT